MVQNMYLHRGLGYSVAILTYHTAQILDEGNFDKFDDLFTVKFKITYIEQYTEN